MSLLHRLFYLPAAMLRHFKIRSRWLAAALLTGHGRSFLKLLLLTPWHAVRYAWGFLRDDPC